MKKKILICDSGISKRHRDIVETLDVGHGIYDEHGHGSQVLGVISKVVPYKNITSIKVLDSHNETNLENLIKTLGVCSTLEHEIICLALAVKTYETCNALNNSINKLISCGKTIICSTYNNWRTSYPACMTGVIGVKTLKNNYNGKNYFFEKGADIQCRLIDRSIFIKGQNNYIPFGGNSLACALMTAHIYSIIKEADGVNVEHHMEMHPYDELVFEKYFKDPDEKLCCIRHAKNRKIVETILDEANINRFRFPLIDQIHDLETLNALLMSFEQNGFMINVKSFLMHKHLKSIDSLARYLSYQRSDNEQI